MFSSTKIIELGSCAFRQPQATSHCRFIHGYRLVGKFWFGANELDENNWVVDFGGLKDLKKKLEQHFDHTTVIADNDPALDSFKKLHKELKQYEDDPYERRAFLYLDIFLKIGILIISFVGGILLKYILK